jgi:hypothetical protein
MRWFVTLFVVFSVAGCWSWANGPAGAGGSTSDAGSQCPQTDCPTCTACAIGGACAAQAEACNADSDCQAIDQCYVTMGCGSDANCQATCDAMNPAGAADHAAYWTCVQCQECSSICGMCSGG